MEKIVNTQQDYKTIYVITANRKLNIDEKKNVIVKYLELHPEVEPLPGMIIEFEYNEISQGE
jgi:hypothetical protein